MSTIETLNLGNLLLSLSDAIDLASPEIALHQQRTAYIALEISQAAHLPQNITRDIFIASLLHDAGAITSEEKIALHRFEEVQIADHCMRGALLMQRVPQLEPLAPIILNHHKPWKNWNEPITVPDVTASQIILLADYIERLIDRNTFILHQRESIRKKVISTAGTMVHPEIVSHFLDISKKEAFWLNIIYPRLFSLLFHTGPLKNTTVDYSILETVSQFFRDIIDFKSPFTATHTAGVTTAADILARKAGMSEKEILEIRIAANLHDLGKLAIPNSILEKPGSLTEREYDIIKSHSFHTYHIINSISGLSSIASMAALHHEKPDGTGYPFCYKEEEISAGTRIITVADMFTAISEDRPYRRAMDKKNIISTFHYLIDNKFVDPGIAGMLLDTYDDIDGHVKAEQEATRKFYTTRLAGSGGQAD